jgi:hypothetical protein
VHKGRVEESEISRLESYLVDNFPITSAMSYCIGKYVEAHFVEVVQPKNHLLYIKGIKSLRG